MLEQVVCGFQDGADIAGVRAARRFSIPTGGWIPRGFLTESGPHPEYADLYGAREHVSPNYPPRTEANVRDSDGTVIFDWTPAPGRSRGTLLAIRACESIGRPILIVSELCEQPWDAEHWIGTHHIKVLNVAGNRVKTVRDHGRMKDFGEIVESFMCEVFRLLGHTEAR